MSLRWRTTLSSLSVAAPATAQVALALRGIKPAEVHAGRRLLERSARPLVASAIELHLKIVGMGLERR
jgi:hypothetical protein